MGESKICTKCKQEKPIVEFCKNKRQKDGYDYRCKACRKEYITAYQKENSKKLREYWKNYHRNHKEKRNQQSRDYGKEYRPKNKGVVNAKTAKRRANKANRTPKWANLAKIREVYQNCPKNMEVDHIIPLQGENVSGLHVAANLQYLTPEENRSKSNKFDLEYNAN